MKHFWLMAMSIVPTFAMAQNKERISTASPQVSIIDTAFAIPQLNRARRIWIYLPKDYTSSKQQYPVLYMHDGQNLFDNATSFVGEWKVDETLDSMKAKCIVVGIDNGGNKRMNEYNMDDVAQFGKGEGKEYLEFMVNTLKPYIDKKYRTLSNKEHTYIAGSSMGGLISFYAGLYYPDIFGVIGVFSPSFWINPAINDEIEKKINKKLHGSQKYFFYAGGSEGQTMVSDMQTVASNMKKYVNPVMTTVVNPAAKHNETAWSAVFPQFYQWLTNDK